MMAPKTSKSLYAWLPHVFTRKHIEMKLDFLPELLQCDISNPQLHALVRSAETAFAEELATRGIRPHRLSYGEAGDIYRESGAIRGLMGQIALTLRGSSVRDCISLAKVLSSELLYIGDLLPEAPLWAVIEEQLDFHLHALGFMDRVQALFALTFRAPKKCSFGLRQRLVESFLAENFDGLPLRNLLLFSFASRNEKARDFCHYKFFDQFILRAPEICAAPLESALPVDALYCFFNNRLPPGRRRKLRFADEEVEEEMTVLELLAPAVRARISILPVTSLFRLLSALSISRVNGYADLEAAALKNLLRQFPTLDCDVALAFLKLVSEANHGSGIGDKSFWDAAQAHLEAHLDRFLELPDPQLRFELLKILALQRRLRMGLFLKKFAPLVEEYMQGPLREWDCLYNIAQALTCLHLMFPRDPRLDLDKFVKQLQFSQKYWNYRQHYFFKMLMRFYDCRQPTWDLSAMDVFGYHAEKEFDIWRLKPALMTPELTQVLRVCQSKLELKMLPLVDYKHSFLIDLANPELKFAVLVRTNATTLSSQREVWDLESTSADLTFFRELQKEILEADEWHVYELDFQVFQAQKDKRAEWLLGELTREFASAVEKRPDPYAELRTEVMDFLKFKTREDMMHKVFLEDEGLLELYEEENERANKKLEKLRAENPPLLPDEVDPFPPFK